jgi:hypothetical protein
MQFGRCDVCVQMEDENKGFIPLSALALVKRISLRA